MEFSIFSFPLEQIGWFLRQISLSGAVGNIFAIIIYLFIGSIPCGIFCILKKRGMCQKIDYMLWGMCLLLLVVLYYMINPGLLPASMLGGGKALLGGTFYSVVVGYLVLRVISEKRKTDLISLQKALRMVLILVMFIFAGAVLLEGIVNLPTSIRNVQEGNYVSDTFFYEAPDLTITYVFLAFQCVVNAVPNVLGAVGVFFSIKALDELLKDSYSEDAVTMIKRVAVFCKKSLIIVVVSGMLFNLAQMLFSSQLHQMQISVNIPVFSILFMLAIHVMARYIEENQRLQQDNDLFI